MADFRHQIVIAGKDQASGAIRAVGESTQGTTRRIADLTATLSHGINIARAFASAARMIGRALAEPIKQAAGQELAQAKLTAALKQQGQFSTAAAAKLAAYANQIQVTTRVTDDVVLSMDTVLLQFGKLTAEQLPRASKAAIDFAEATGQDVLGATALLAKALGSSTNALSRYGIEFDNSLRGAERFEAMMEAIESRVGGTAEVIGQTFTGQIQRMSNAWGEAQERVGDFVVKDPIVRAMLEAITTEMLGFADAITATGQDADGMGRKFVSIAQRAIPAFLDGIATLIDALGGKGELGVAMNGFITIFDAAYAVISSTARVLSAAVVGFVAVAKAMQGATAEAAALVKESNDLLLSVAEPLDDALNRMIARFAESGEDSGVFATRIRDLAEALREMALAGKDAGGLEIVNGEIIVRAPGVDGEQMGANLATLVVEGYARELERQAGVLEDAWAEQWETWAENGVEITGAALDTISDSLVDHSTTWKEQYEEFGESVKSTMLDAFLEPILGAQSALAGLAGAMLSPFAAVGQAINDVLFKPLVSGLLQFLGLKAALEEADLKRQQANAVRGVAATVGPAAAALAAMMPGLAAGAVASLVMTFGASASAAAMLPALLTSAAADGAATGAAMAGAATAATGSFAVGGHVMERTIAEIGEAGTETVVPWERPARARQLLAEMFAARPSLAPGGSTTINNWSISVSGATDARTLAGDLVAEMDRRIGRRTR